MYRYCKNAAVKTYIFLLLFLFGASTAYAKGQLGVQLSPGMSINRVHTNPNNAGILGGRRAFGSKLGIIYDYPIQDRYYFSTGLLYATQHLAIKNEYVSPIIREEHMLQLFQVPLLLKLYTSELTLDTRLYVMLGLLGQIRGSQRNTELPKGQTKPFLEAFCRWGGAVLFGIGIEHSTSLSTSIFAGIGYHHGISSMIDEQDQTRSIPRVLGYGDMLSLDVGVRF